MQPGVPPPTRRTRAIMNRRTISTWRALRVLREGGTTDAERADYAFRLCTGRRARPAEQAEVVALLNDRRKRLAEGWLSINEVATGDPAKSPAIPPDTIPQDAAAWTIAARVLLNLDETLSKN